MMRSIGNHVRLDDRLIHGQVILDWLRFFESGTVILLLADADATLQNVMRSALPARFELLIGSPPQAAMMLADSSATIALVLAPDVNSITQLAAAGYVPGAIILGAQGAKPGRRRISQQVYLSQQEMEALQSLAQQGTRIIIQARYYDSPTVWESVYRAV